MTFKLRILPALFILFLSCGPGEQEDTKTTTPEKPDSTPQASTQVLPPNTPYSGVDVSPMDMCYFPIDYPKIKMGKLTNDPPLARVIYSRPHLQGRRLFSDIQKFGEEWRLGANESTELQLFTSATIQDRKIAAGRYILYCIPEKTEWTIVLNSNIDTWGLERDESKDVARFRVPVTQTPWKLEYLSMAFENTDSSRRNANLLMAWDNVEARLPFKF
jgi:hypothetical protein